jgi:hypothetical protein
VKKTRENNGPADLPIGSEWASGLGLATIPPQYKRFPVVLAKSAA